MALATLPSTSILEYASHFGHSIALLRMLGMRAVCMFSQAENLVGIAKRIPDLRQLNPPRGY